MKMLRLCIALSFLAASLSASLGGEGKKEFTLSSPSIVDGGTIPAKYEHLRGKKDVSPPLVWSNPPNGVKSFAISCVDTHHMANRWVHWMVVNIPGSATSLEEGASQASMPEGSKELYSNFCTSGWGGPRPPKGSGEHKYVFTIYALDTPLISPGSSVTGEMEFIKMLGGHVIGKVSLTGTFERFK